MAKIERSIVLNFEPVEAEKILRERISQGNELKKEKPDSIKAWKLIEKQFNQWNSENYDILKKMFQKNTVAKDYASSSWNIGGILLTDLKLNEKTEKLEKNLDERIKKLQSILQSLDVFYKKSNNKIQKKKVFFIYGTDCQTKFTLLHFLKNLGLEVIILNELAAAGKTLVDEIQKQKEVKQAIALLTPDNVAAPYSHKPHFIAEQNVILELGIFIGTFGRENVFALYDESVKLPADYHGFEYIKIDNTNMWMKELAEQLKESGLEVRE